MILNGVKVEFGLLIDKTIETDNVTANATTQSEVSNTYDTLNTGEKQKIAYLEDNYWLLDGSFIMPFVNFPYSEKNLVKNNSFEEDGAWITDEGTFTRDNTIYHVGKYSGKLEGSSASIHQSGITTVAGHHYFFGLYIKTNATLTKQSSNPSNYVSLQINRYSLSFHIDRDNYTKKGEWQFIGGHQVAISPLNIGNAYFEIQYYTRVLNPAPVYVDDIFLLDLTEMFGENADFESISKYLTNVFNSANDYGKYVVGYEGLRAGQMDTLIYVFDHLHDSYGITLKFPPTSIPTEFEIAYYNGGTLINETHIVRDNTLETYTNEDTRLQWNRVIITIRAPKAGQRCRLQHVIFGINDQYKEDELIEVKANRTLSPTAEYADSGEVSFSFFNDGRYNIQTIKELSQNVIDRLKMQVYVRRQFETEYTPFCVYYAESGKVEERGHIITLTGHDGIFKLDDVMFTAGKVYPAGRSLADWGREIAQVAGVQIEISAAFESIMSKGYIAEVPCREAFRLTAEAGHGIFGVDENDVMHLWAYGDIVKNSGEITNDNIVDKSFVLENGNKYMGVKVTQYTFTRRTAEEELGRMENLAISTFPADPDTIRVSATSGTVTTVEKTNSHVKFTIVGASETEVNVSAYGIAYDVATTVIERGETKKDVKEISGNFLITEGMGDTVADYQQKYAVNKYDYEAETFTEEDLQLGEVREMQGQSVVITDVGFSISYGEQSEEIKGVDE